MEKVWMRGVPGRGDEVIDMLKTFGGGVSAHSSQHSEDPRFICFINHAGNIDSVHENFELAKVIMDCYKPIGLPAFKGHKIFKPFQKVLRKDYDLNDLYWTADFYGYCFEGTNHHILVSGAVVLNDDDIIPYEGNEDKLGKPSKQQEKDDDCCDRHIGVVYKR